MTTNPVIITYLEMLAPPSVVVPSPNDTLVMQAIAPTIPFYRYLYNTVGEAWQWFDRRKLSDTDLALIVQHPQVEVNVLYKNGVPAGYAELNKRLFPEIELAYFGLMPEFIGQGLGRFLLNWAIRRAWSHQPNRLWVHTCNLDHPNALSVYQKAGFQIYKQKEKAPSSS